MIRVGTAGWSIPKPLAALFPSDGSHLQRYAQRLDAVEINSCFYRSHRPETYARWASSVPPGFRFAVKLPREISHIRALSDATEPLDRFLTEIRALGDALGPILVQLPPSLRFDADVASRFLDSLRSRFDGYVVCEPRHPAWFTGAVADLLSSFRIARAAVDPAPVPQAAEPGGWTGLIYRRLHGSPRIYYSAYSPACVAHTAGLIRQTPQGIENWCIFDNTALGEATSNALMLVQCLRQAHGNPANMQN